MIGKQRNVNVREKVNRMRVTCVNPCVKSVKMCNVKIVPNVTLLP